MDKDNALVQVTPDDITALENDLAGSRKPATTRELAEKLAFLKTAGQRLLEVKAYDPSCLYEVGDAIYKEYDESLIVGSKLHEPFQGAVVLTVVKKLFYKDFNCEMLEVDYSGGGVFRKHIDYMKKAKTQVLLPSNVGGTNARPTVIPRDRDPRLTELPMTERDIKTLERHLKQILAKNPAFFSWGGNWQLAAAQPAIPEDKVKEIEASLRATKMSATTEALVRGFFDLEPSHDLFDLHCLTLNHVLETKGKKEFILVQPVGWGKWHLKSVLAALPEGLALSSPPAKVPEFEGPDIQAVTPFHDFPLKVYLGWREILSGGVKIPKSFNKELAHAREYVFTDADEKKHYLVHYFPQQGYFLGLKDFFAAANIPQGTSMTLEKAGPVQFNFWLKKSKKKIGVATMTYDPAEDRFAEAGEAATLAMPNKIIHLERDQLVRLTALYPEREGLDLKDLLVLVFKNFSLGVAGHALHYLRAYHLVDVLRRTTQEDVEFTLLNAAEFEKSEKKKGLFYFREAVPLKEAAPAPAVEEAPAEAAAEPGEFEEEIPSIEFTVLAEAPAELPAEAAAFAEAEAELEAFEEKKKPKKEEKAPPAAKKEKKKLKPEGDRRPKTRKSERRVLEEEIAEEEGQREAFFAEKGAEEDVLEGISAEGAGPEAAGEPGVEEAKPAEPGPLGAFGGLFAEKLKLAIKKKREEAAKAADEPESPEK
ncbi:MAG: hypothetical protein FJY82_11080 [Candidatus Aminicenantes bacterium]|nr:hypothetical protein [Candidatus Aminicenantes bacterium]